MTVGGVGGVGGPHGVFWGVVLKKGALKRRSRPEGGGHFGGSTLGVSILGSKNLALRAEN